MAQGDPTGLSAAVEGGPLEQNAGRLKPNCRDRGPRLLKAIRWDEAAHG